MSSLDLVELKDRPAAVRFETLAVEDKAKSLAKGCWVGRDVHYAVITPVGSKDQFKQETADWEANLDREVSQRRMPRAWADNYKESFKKYLAGQELPVNGTPLKMFALLSPAQIAQLISMNVLTVEDLAGLNAEGTTRIGMGAIELKKKAKAWLDQANGTGPTAAKIAAMEMDNQGLKEQVNSLTVQVTRLTNELKAAAQLVVAPAANAVASAPAIDADSLFED